MVAQVAVDAETNSHKYYLIYKDNDKVRMNVMDISYITEGNNLVFAGKQGKETVSVLYLSPAMSNYGDNLCEIKNINTKEKYRRQGCMDELLKEAFECVQSEKEPFVYLYTEEPEIFEKYGFVKINEKPVLTLNPKRISEKLLEESMENQSGFTMLVNKLGTMECHVVKESECARAARFISAYNKEHRAIYKIVNEDMLLEQKKELKSRHGDLFMLEFEGIVKAVFSVVVSKQFITAEVICMEEEIKAWNVFVETDAMRCCMVRVVDAGKLVEMILSDREFVMALRIKDDKLIENEGLYMIHGGPLGGPLTSVKIQNENMQKNGECLSAEGEITIEDLAYFAFGVKPAADTFKIYVKSQTDEKLNRLDELAGVIWE